MESTKRKPILKSALLISFTLIISSCAHIRLVDAEWCGDEGQIGAKCFHTFSATERKIDKPTWDAERLGMICTKSENFADWKKDILQLCSQTKNCTHEDIQVLNHLASKAEEATRLRSE